MSSGYPSWRGKQQALSSYRKYLNLTQVPGSFSDSHLSDLKPQQADIDLALVGGSGSSVWSVGGWRGRVHLTWAVARGMHSASDGNENVLSYSVIMKRTVWLVLPAT